MDNKIIEANININDNQELNSIVHKLAKNCVTASDYFVPLENNPISVMVYDLVQIINKMDSFSSFFKNKHDKNFTCGYVNFDKTIHRIDKCTMSTGLIIPSLTVRKDTAWETIVDINAIVEYLMLNKVASYIEDDVLYIQCGYGVAQLEIDKNRKICAIGFINGMKLPNDKVEEYMTYIINETDILWYLLMMLLAGCSKDFQKTRL